MATSASLSLLLRRPRKTAWFIIRLLSSLPLSSTPNSDSVSSSNPSSDSKPPTLSSRLSFVFDQLDSLSKPPDLSDQDSALRRICSWWRRSDTHPDKEEKEELLKQNPKENMEATSMAELELVHPWPEWIEIMERLAKHNYFDLSRVDEQHVAYDVPIDLSEFKEEVSLDLSRDWLTVRNACMNFGRDRFDIIRSLQRKDIQTLVGHGCPSLEPKVIFSAKLLRKLVHLDEGDVCSTCSLRNSCSRGYILVPKEDEARTLDIMRILLTFGFDHANGSVENKDLMKLKQVKNVVRKLMHEVARLSAVPIDPRLPPPVLKKREVKVKQPPPPPKKKRVGRDDVEMKKGDWLCPKCDFMNFAKNTVCMQCDAKRPKRQLLPGEWECPRCQFLNYRRNMACYECEHEHPPDEYTSNQMDSRQPGPTRTWPERGPPSCVPEVSDAWNFDFDDNESDGADVAAFEFADSSKGNLEQGDLTGSRGRRSELHERKAVPYSSKTGFDDFDDEDDDLDNYEIDSSPRAGNDSGVARRSFSDFEESDVDDYEDFNCSKKNSERRSRASLNASDSDDEELINRANVRGKRGELKFDSDSDYDDDNDFRSNNAKRNPRASFSDSESDADDYRPSMENHSKGGKFGSRSDFGRVRGTNRSGRDGTVHCQEDSGRKSSSRFCSDGGFRGSQNNERRASFSDSESDADDYRPSMEKHSKGGKFGSRSDFGRVRGTNRSGRDGTVCYQKDSWRKSSSRFDSDGGFRGSQKNERSSRGGFERRRDNVPGKSDESFRFNRTRRHQAGNNSFGDWRRDNVHGKQDESFRFNRRHQAGNRSFDRHGRDDFQNSDVVDRPRRIRGMHTLIRDKDITTPDFVFYSDCLIHLVVEHGLGHLPFTEKQVVTPTGSAYTGVDFCKKLCGVSIIRSGESMENALRACCKGIKIGKILIHREGDNGQQLIYEKLPKDIAERRVLLLDPVLGTGNSANQAIDLLIRKGVPENHIIFLNLISAPEGIHTVCKRFPAVKIVTSEIDVGLNEEYRVIPGLDEFGDRYFGTDN